jgi:5-dehydro-2-deoxygluconokinase
VPGFIGFAVGRTSFQDPLIGLRDRKFSREAAAARIADRYAEWIAAFTAARAG